MKNSHSIIILLKPSSNCICISFNDVSQAFKPMKFLCFFVLDIFLICLRLCGKLALSKKWEQLH